MFGKTNSSGSFVIICISFVRMCPEKPHLRENGSSLQLKHMDGNRPPGFACLLAPRARPTSHARSHPRARPTSISTTKTFALPSSTPCDRSLAPKLRCASPCSDSRECPELSPPRLPRSCLLLDATLQPAANAAPRRSRPGLT
jgi:hypothetical protein